MDSGPAVSGLDQEYGNQHIMTEKAGTGIIVGRFQVVDLNDAHKELIETSTTYADFFLKRLTINS